MKPLTIPLATPVTLLVLIGGGEFSFGETREIDDFLLAHLPEGKRTVAFVPTASGSAEYGVHFGRYLKTLADDVELTNVPIYRGRDGKRGKNLAAFAATGMIYLGGGVTNHLLDALHSSPADLAMRDAAANGAVVAAIGAAASCLGTWTRDSRGPSALPGLGWLANTVVDTGFEPADDTPLRRLMSAPEAELGIGIPPRTAIAIRAGGEAEIIGDGQIAVFRKGKA